MSSAAQSHSSHSGTRCSNAYATTQSRSRNTAVQHPTHCARDSAGDAASMLHIFAGPTHISRTCRPAPRSPLPSHRKNARTDTRWDKPHTAQRHGSVMARVTQKRTPTAHATHIAHSYAEYRHTSPAHTHCRAVRLPSIDGMLPDSWLTHTHKNLQNTRTAIASHHGTRHRHRRRPAARNASQCSAAHNINQVK